MEIPSILWNIRRRFARASGGFVVSLKFSRRASDPWAHLPSNRAARYIG